MWEEIRDTSVWGKKKISEKSFSSENLEILEKQETGIIRKSV